ncbi:rhodanese-related sulfurtransferase [Xenococcus sp. PCC 7305]|uniref:sulfurtransferase n=1 Tax=Xenococcus sp. PCC 7305 TaxID=102125 RepID=UPI0002ABBE41|nr:sulfurtransferase [Xenococcus sp. PCC 7305]ELS02834.1 rhodanese-related sulfurtransferase [Xenococcus sp. PCC 7305]
MFEYAYPEILVDTQWLSAHLEDPNVRIIEMDLSSELYEQGHIPGSIFWNAMTTSLTPDLRFNFDQAAMSEMLGNAGITNETTIVTVHHSYAATSGCLFWLFKVSGHDKVRILNGGRQKWLMDGYSLTKEKTIVEKTQYRAQTPDKSSIISLEEVQKSLGKDDCILLDVRTPQEYGGEIFLMEPPKDNERAGHIPGAINLYYELAHNDDGTFKSYTELQELFAQKNVTAEKLIIPYCALGARSGHTWFILKYLLGYPNVKNYDGSWNEWSRISSLPIEI